MPKTPQYLTATRPARDIREGDRIMHLDGEPAQVLRAGMHKDKFGWAYDFSFVGGRTPYACRGDEPVTVVKDMPKVGDKATLSLPSDCYPYEVVAVSKTGKTLQVRRLTHDLKPTNSEPRKATWSAKRGRFQCGGLPLSVGHARYYQAPEV